MIGLNHNLFNYATKELSQDAFIAWLCSFALDKEGNDPELTKCAQSLICEFMRRGLNTEIDSKQVKLELIEKQKERIDVLLSVLYKDELFKIIIEDKVNSSEHGNQLTDYMEKIKKTTPNVIGIYFKTGFQSDLSRVNATGYKVFNRKDMLTLLRGCNSKNDIFLDFRNYWENFEKITNSYKELPLREWPDWQALNGFFEELQETLIGKGLWAGYDYVNNKGGGFWGLWYGSNEYDAIEKDSIKASFYLQIEAKWDYDINCYTVRICSKLSDQVSDVEDDGIMRLRKLILEKQSKYGFSKPNWMRNGYHMTLGVFNADINTREEFITAALKAFDEYKLLVEEIRREL